METYHKINAPFMRDMDGSVTGKKGQLIVGQWARPEYEYLADNQWEFTEKVDGTNIRIGWDYQKYKVEFGGRSDNAVIPNPLIDYLEDTFNSYLFEKAGLNQAPVTLFGEGYGPKIQGGGKYRSDHSFVLFDVKIGDFWLDRANVNDVASKLGIESVPVLGTGTLWQAIDVVKHGFYDNGDNRLVNVSKAPDHLQSTWGDFEAEGLVIRPTVPLFNRMGDRIILKVKAKDFR